MLRAMNVVTSVVNVVPGGGADHTAVSAGDRRRDRDIENSCRTACFQCLIGTTTGDPLNLFDGIRRRRVDDICGSELTRQLAA